MLRFPMKGLKEVEKIRKDFPIFENRINGKPLTYLDSAATSQKPATVIKRVEEFYRSEYANVHRGIYHLSEQATALYIDAHKKIASFINANSFKEIIFLRNATEAINLVAMTWARDNIRKGDVILLTEMEHHSNIVPWQLLAKEKEAELQYIAVDSQGILDQDDFETKLEQKNVRFVGLTHVSNFLGTINPVKQMVNQAHKVGAVVLIDGAQAVPHLEVNVKDIDCDFYAFSGHKMLAPTGSGVLYGKTDLLRAMRPFLSGGDMVRDVTFEEATWNDLPWKFEAGTPAIAEGIGLAAAADYLAQIGMDKIKRGEEELVRECYQRLKEIKGVNIYGPSPDQRGGIIAFNIDKIHPHDVAWGLNREGIAVRAGHHCAAPMHKKLGLAASIRASFYLYNNFEDIERLCQGVETLQKLLGA